MLSGAIETPFTTTTWARAVPRQRVPPTLFRPLARRVATVVDTWRDGRSRSQDHPDATELLDSVLDEIGKTRLRALTADDVREALAVIAATRTTRTIRDTRASLVRAITYAQSHGKVGRNVVSLRAGKRAQAHLVEMGLRGSYWLPGDYQ